MNAQNRERKIYYIYRYTHFIISLAEWSGGVGGDGSTSINYIRFPLFRQTEISREIEFLAVRTRIIIIYLYRIRI